MPVQKVSGTITFQDSEIEVKPFSEVHLFSIAEFITNLKDASTTPDKWFAIASLLSSKIPDLVDQGYVELDSLTKTGDLFLNAKQLQELYSGLFKLWESQTNLEILELDKQATDVGSETIEDLEARLMQMKANAVTVKEG
jgi:hypothetical protein